MKKYLNEIKRHGSFNMFALKELSHFKNIIKKKISLFPVIFSLYYLLYFLYKTSNKIFEIDSFKNFVDLKFFDEN